jgi:hypothetical protein
LEDKKILLSKLSTIFDPETAENFIYPKTYETRKHLTIEDLKHGKYVQTKMIFKLIYLIRTRIILMDDKYGYPIFHLNNHNPSNIGYNRFFTIEQFY